MKKKSLHKSIVREIFESKARFLSILGIILLGVCFYAGIKATGPNMINTANHYFNQQQLMDSKIISTLGLTEKDLAALSQFSEIASYQGTYSKDVNLIKDNRVVRFFSFDKQEQRSLNQFTIVAGKLPNKSGEIAIDSKESLLGNYKIGDSYKIVSDEETEKIFKVKSFKVVGFVKTPIYIENTTRGNTNIGKGAVDYFAVLPAQDIEMQAYTEVYVTYKNLRNIDTYTSEYDKKLHADEKKVKELLKNRPTERLQEIKEAAEKPINEAKEEMTKGEVELNQAATQLTEGKAELVSGQVELAQAEKMFQQEIQNGEIKLDTSEVELQNAGAQLAAEREKLAEGERLLDSAAQQIAAGEKQLQQNQIDPNGHVADWLQQKSVLEQTNQQLIVFSNDIQGTLATTPVEEAIAPDKIRTWQEIVVSSGLTSLQEALNLLAANPLDKEAASRMIGILNQMSQSLQQNIVSLTQLSQIVSEFQASRGAYQEQLTKWNEGKAQLVVAQNQLNQGQEQLQEGRIQLAQAKVEGQAKLDGGNQKLVEAQGELTKGEEKYQAEKQKLADGKAEIKQQEQKLADLKEPEYFYFSREDNPGFSEYHENAQRISSIATVFPVFFLMIAALVSLTTMTRMVDEKRNELGTLKALGYKNWEIAQKYVIYASLASVIGSVLGIGIGYNVFPTVIFNAYGSLYNLPDIILTYYPSYIIQSIIVALLCTVISAIVVLRLDLFSSPATLMRPKAPKAGQRIFLERLTFLWNKLNFIQKVTARNLFRYKQRMLMTILGIAGCMAMIITGFGLKDSISDIVTIQFDKLWHYQAIVTYNEEATSEETSTYQKELASLSGFQKSMPVAQKKLSYLKKGTTTQEVMINVPQRKEDMKQFVLFQDRKTEEKYSLTDDGAIINEKLAKLYQVKAGDSMMLKDSNNQNYKVKISHVVENYIMHFVYMTPEYYQQIFKQTPIYNSELLLFKNVPKNEDKVSEELMATKKAVNVTFLSQTSEALDDTMKSLTIVVWVLIISAAILAFIVLYNLTNINISERIRELSTIKVLGFYDNEVTLYVYRENNILTMLGILLGCFAGKLLHGFVLRTAEVDMMMFSPRIHWESYLYSGLLTILFSTVVMLLMHRKLRKVDMIEALKSNE